MIKQHTTALNATIPAVTELQNRLTAVSGSIQGLGAKLDEVAAKLPAAPGAGA
jgi:hypothetical protein